MRWYARAWLVVWAPLGFVGSVAGLAAGPRGPIIAIGVLAGATAALTAGCHDKPQGPGDAPSCATVTDTARKALLRGTYVGSIALIAGAMVALLGGLAYPVLALAAASSPPAMAQLCRRIRHAAAFGAKHPNRPAAHLSTAQLCQAWCSSYVRVAAASSPALLAEEAHRRERYLDEMERRNAVGFHSWLKTAPLPHDDPECFL